MSRAKLAMALWVLLAIVVFNVRFDWRTRTAGFEFVQAQLARRHSGQPPLTINNGFRPMVRDAAREASVWLIAIAAFGTIAVGAVQAKNR